MLIWYITTSSPKDNHQKYPYPHGTKKHTSPTLRWTIYSTWNCSNSQEYFSWVGITKIWHDVVVAPTPLHLFHILDLNHNVESMDPKYCSQPIMLLNFRIYLVLDLMVNKSWTQPLKVSKNQAWHEYIISTSPHQVLRSSFEVFLRGWKFTQNIM